MEAKRISLQKCLMKFDKELWPLIRNAYKLTTEEQMIGIYNGYIDSGCARNFIYYSDTVKFFDKHRLAIIKLLLDEHKHRLAMIKLLLDEHFEIYGADELGFIEGICSWNCLGGQSFNKSKASDKVDMVVEVIGAIAGRKSEETVKAKNALTWGAMETIARCCVEED